MAMTACAVSVRSWTVHAVLVGLLPLSLYVITSTHQAMELVNIKPKKTGAFQGSLQISSAEIHTFEILRHDCGAKVH